MTCGGAVATAVLREGMARSEFRCHSAAGGAKRTEIPLPIGPAKSVQDTDYNGVCAAEGARFGSRKTFSPCWQGKAQGAIALGCAWR